MFCPMHLRSLCHGIYLAWGADGSNAIHGTCEQLANNACMHSAGHQCCLLTMLSSPPLSACRLRYYKQTL